MEGVADSSVDVVVMTLVLCSVSDPDKVLRQVLRVLVPVSPTLLLIWIGSCWTFLQRKKILCLNLSYIIMNQKM